MENASLFAVSQSLPLRLAKLASLAICSSIFLGGCGSGQGGALVGGGGASAMLTPFGQVYGGQQPISGATIQLYAVGTAATGGASTALLSQSVITSDGTGVGGNASNNFNSLPIGSFTITGGYSCTGATETYITSTGGNAGGGTNTSIALMAALEPCASLTPATFVNINELTTVAAANALAPFMTDYAHIGSNVTSNPNGMTNAFNMANTLISFQSGQAPSTSAGITLPTIIVQTLGDIIASCVNSASASSGPACTTLLSTTGASETVGAALAIAKNPGASTILALFNLVPSTPPFVAATIAPNDFTLAVKYSGSELLSPSGVAIDAGGNAWVTNEAGFSVVKLPSFTSSFATTTYSSGGLVSPRGISIDRSGNIWIANTGANTVVKLNSSGVAQSGSGYTTDISVPVAISNDSAGNAWVANYGGNSITELGTTGTPSGASPITGSGSISEPTSVALDSTGRVVVANAGTGQLCLFSNAAALQSCVSDGYLFGSTAVAVSTTGNVALAGTTTGNAVSGAFMLATNTGTVNAASPVLGGGLTVPTAVAYDGGGNAWFANSASISEFSGSTAISPSAGYGTVSSPAGIAVDSSGNIWTTNSGDNSVSVFVGLGTPIVTPLAANVGP